MRIRNIQQLNGFMLALNQCRGGVWLESPEGDKYNLKSQFSQYVALGELLSERGEYLELYCTHKEDEQYFYEYLWNQPEVRA